MRLHKVNEETVETTALSVPDQVRDIFENTPAMKVVIYYVDQSESGKVSRWMTSWERVREVEEQG